MMGEKQVKKSLREEIDNINKQFIDYKWVWMHYLKRVEKRTNIKVSVLSIVLVISWLVGLWILLQSR